MEDGGNCLRIVFNGGLLALAMLKLLVQYPENSLIIGDYSVFRTESTLARCTSGIVRILCSCSFVYMCNCTVSTAEMLLLWWIKHNVYRVRHCVTKCYTVTWGLKGYYEWASVKVDVNEPFLCWTVIQFIAALTLQIALKLQNVLKCIYKVKYMWKHLHGDRSQIPDKCSITKPTAWLQTPAKRRLHQTPP
jgi:hypothetical protein